MLFWATTSLPVVPEMRVIWYIARGSLLDEAIIYTSSDKQSIFLTICDCMVVPIMSWVLSRNKSFLYVSRNSQRFERCSIHASSWVYWWGAAKAFLSLASARMPAATTESSWQVPESSDPTVCASNQQSAASRWTPALIMIPNSYLVEVSNSRVYQ